MNQKKIGEFIRELRKEKGLTQEQMAEHFNISGRTVSRWETGANMPDISIISEIAGFFEVDIREIINGERDKAQAETEDIVSKVIEYADTEKGKLSKKVTRYSIVGLVSMLIFVLISKYGIGGQGIIPSILESLSMMFVYFALSQNLLFTTGRLEKKVENRKKQSLKLKVLRLLLLIGALIFISAIISVFMVENA